jgi:DNA invertase Pin-like site-specific DNA recombinase
LIVTRHQPSKHLGIRGGAYQRSHAARPAGSIDTGSLLNTLATIAGRKAGFRSLGGTWADITSAHGRLMLTVLGGLAGFERELIRTRTGEGRTRAKARGVKMGRPPKLTPHQVKEALRRRGEHQASDPLHQSPVVQALLTASRLIA